MKRSVTLPALALAIALAAGCSNTSEPQASVEATSQAPSHSTDLTGITFEVFRDPG